MQSSSIEKLVDQGIVTLQTGPFGSQLHSYDYQKQGIAVIPTEAIKDRRIVHEVLPKISSDKSRQLARHILEERDILFARRGAQATGRTAIIRKEEVGFVCGTGAIRLRVTKKQNVVSPEFLSWFLVAPKTIAWIREQAIGATMPNLNEGIIKRIEIPLPALKRQHTIAATLGALDDKIELNRRMCGTLEDMARALYRSWFVDYDPVHARAAGQPCAHMSPATAALFPDRFDEDGLPEGWEIGSLSVFSELAPEKWSKKNAPGQIEYVDLSNTNWGRIDKTTAYDWETAPSRARLVLRPGDTIVGTVRPGNGAYSLIAKDGLTGSTEFAVLRPKSDRDEAFVYCAATSRENIDSLANLADGGAYPAVRPDAVLQTDAAIAPDGVMTAFSEFVSPFLEQLSHNNSQNQTLAALRDTLLPKLMSGEIRVKDAEAQIEKVI